MLNDCSISFDALSLLLYPCYILVYPLLLFRSHDTHENTVNYDRARTLIRIHDRIRHLRSI